MQHETVIAANRFGLGARPGDLARIDHDPRHWLRQQLNGPPRPPTALAALPSTASVLDQVQALRRSQRRQPAAAADVPAPDIVERYSRVVREHYIAQVAARYRAAAASDTPFFERLVHFWSNHFAVSADKQPLPAIAGLFEQEAIRPNVTGPFANLLSAAIRHPAMILYLDNQRSIGPNSRLGRRAARARPDNTLGLNENLAREILELHTLGVDGGYDQTDVTAFARVLTGWSIGGAGERGRFAEGTPGTFEFREQIHEPGAQVILGKRYAERGVRQGEAVLGDLAVHPSTANFLARKLARHFVADDPPDGIVTALAEAYLDSGGALTRVYATLIDLGLADQPLTRKYKTPHDFVLSALRAFNHVPEAPQFLVGALDLLGQPAYRPGSPAGWPDTAEEWGGADALYKRIEWSDTVARFVGARVNPLRLGDTVLGPAFSAPTRRVVAGAERLAQGLTLLLASPDFQRR